MTTIFFSILHLTPLHEDKKQNKLKDNSMTTMHFRHHF